MGCYIKDPPKNKAHDEVLGALQSCITADVILLIRKSKEMEII